MVPLAGIEPALLAELDFESSASTSSATGAIVSGRVGLTKRVNYSCGEGGVKALKAGAVPAGFAGNIKRMW